MDKLYDDEVLGRYIKNIENRGHSWSEGGNMSSPKLWDALSMGEKADMMKVAVRNGITDLKTIREKYNEFAEGGNILDGGGGLTPRQEAMRYFMNKGLTDYQAAGLVGNLIRESQLIPTATNAGSGAYGIAQWLGPRKKALVSRYGKSPSLQQQLDFVWDELNSTHKTGLSKLRASRDVAEAARNAMGYYEFSAGPDAAVREMKKWGQDGEGSMRKGIEFASALLGQPVPEYTPQVQPIAQQPEMKFTPLHPEVFGLPVARREEPVVYEIPEPAAETVKEPTEAELRRQRREDNMRKFGLMMSLLSGSESDSPFSGIMGMMSGDTVQPFGMFAEGGYLDWKEKANKYKHLDIDNDRTYDYEGWYNENPQRAWDFLNDSPDAHFDDKYKTFYHPTFSTQSKYSGQKDATYNPQGLVGGTWNKQGTVFTMSPDGYRGPVSMDDRKWYLENNEDNGVVLREADGSLPVYDGIPWGGVLPNIIINGNRRDRKFEDGGFTSELDWSPNSWFSKRVAKPDGTLYNNEEAARLASHVPEYNNIEQIAKANGTWLKMPDGSTWEGDPRSWVMMQSEAYKKNYSPKPWYTGQAEWPTTFDYGEGKVDTNKVTRAPYYNNQMWFSDSKDYGQTFADYQNSTGLGWRFDTPGEEDIKGHNFLSAIPKEGNYRTLESPANGRPDQWQRLPFVLEDGTINRLPESQISVDSKGRNIRADKQKVLTDDVVNWSKNLGDQGIFMQNIDDGAIIKNGEILRQPVNEFISQPGFTDKVKFIEGNTGDFDIDNPYKYANNFYVKDNSLDNNYAALGGPLVEAAMNEYRNGGKIHIKPENRGKFTALKERTGHSATWFKEHGTPAQKKMATFALNARHWKHGMGGNLFDGFSEPTQQMNTGNVLAYYPDKDYYIGPQTRLPEVTVTGEAPSWLGKKGLYPTRYRYNPSRHVSARTKQLTAGDVMKGIDAATGPLLHWAQPSQYIGAFRDAVEGKNPLTSMLRGNSGVVSEEYAQEHPWLSTAFNLGTDIVALGGLSKIPMDKAVSAVERGAEKASTLFNSPLTGRWTQIGSREYRLNPNSLGASGVPLESRTVTPRITAENAASITPEQWTAAQDAAIAKGDMVEAQRLRDLHSSLTDSATPGKYYRGTQTKRNSYPDRHIDEEVGEMNGIYLTKKPKYAKTYGDVEEFYLRSNNPLKTEGSWTGVIDDATRAEIENAGYDAVVNNRFDTGFLNKLLRNSRDETITFNGKNLKLADAVTYDDKGVRIPLGERDNFKLNDIRYSWLAPVIGLGTLGTLYEAPTDKTYYR